MQKRFWLLLFSDLWFSYVSQAADSRVARSVKADWSDPRFVAARVELHKRTDRAVVRSSSGRLLERMAESAFAYRASLNSHRRLPVTMFDCIADVFSAEEDIRHQSSDDYLGVLPQYIEDLEALRSFRQETIAEDEQYMTREEKVQAYSRAYCKEEWETCFKYQARFQDGLLIFKNTSPAYPLIMAACACVDEGQRGLVKVIDFSNVYFGEFPANLRSLFPNLQKVMLSKTNLVMRACECCTASSRVTLCGASLPVVQVNRGDAWVLEYKVRSVSAKNVFFIQPHHNDIVVSLDGRVHCLFYSCVDQKISLGDMYNPVTLGLMAEATRQIRENPVSIVARDPSAYEE